MELRQLEALRTIVATGSFAAAAERLRLTQPALSHQIKNLEDELGATLLIRARPKVYASPAGELVLSAADRIFSEVGMIREHFPKSGSDKVASTIRIAATNLGIVYIFGDLCEAFLARNPRIELIFRATETSEEALRRVLDGSADVAFGPLPHEHSQLTAVKLGVAEHAFVVGPAHPLAASKVVTLTQLKQWPLVRFQPGSGSREVADVVFAGIGYPPIMMESNDAEFIKKVVGLGSGVALMPAFAMQRELRTGKLKLLKLDHESLNVEFGLSHRSNVQRKSIELLKTLCVEMRGPTLRRITVTSRNAHPFR
ncbi:MAG TPA: LysR family transcriptional regulator [Steroidobacteraceae bacterium]|jgi:DNA-binding transcriptional LysR family regulator|nr:LysR family transcriptional regulator [Steroidobacteraceae bacterium]